MNDAGNQVMRLGVPFVHEMRNGRPNPNCPACREEIDA